MIMRPGGSSQDRGENAWRFSPSWSPDICPPEVDARVCEGAGQRSIAGLTQPNFSPSPSPRMSAAEAGEPALCEVCLCGRARSCARMCRREDGQTVYADVTL